VLTEFPKENQAELDEKLIPLVPFSQIHFRIPIFDKNKIAGSKRRNKGSFCKQLIAKKSKKN
jgi:hypothetical protein